MKNKGNGLALIPLGVFLLVYLGTSIVAKDFYAVSVIVPFLAAALTALIMNRKIKFDEKVEIFCKGAGNTNILLMIIIFILAGAFAQVAKDMGAVDSTVNLGLSLLPSSLLIPGIFVIGCFISLSIGTSMGTIVALVPIAVGIADKTGIATALAVGAVVSGAMFGDNLSIISDTTISATRTQGCEMKDKFKMNFKIVLPAAIITAVIFMLLTKNSAVVNLEVLEFNLFKILPYIIVIVTALLGVNVIVVLLLGILSSGVIGFIFGSFDIIGLFNSISSGISAMSELIIISILIAGTIEIIKFNGGIDFILNKGLKNFKSKRGAEYGIAMLVSLVDICTANNTVAIVTVGPIAKDISNEFDLEPKRVAGILDMFSCVFQGIIPYGAQLISAAGLAALSPFAIMKFLFYPYLMGICAIIAIYIHWRSK
ncbi:Na+/H+ antiporter NhaC family protein [Clostridium tertium]|uniref:Na+/H+ antiporter NhaC family protein n=1 Tax=Clostridium TaxID=1485 RepID=UPI001DC38A39|nr:MULTISPECIES: Na+/H+ antiporter NhaC family protein [Clostridium]MBS5306876.1 Na+/H+ antiporter NhaC family protein [Clostridium sp.]MDB1921097.1 Na+/H+ antiporter NhaC family protein [Clostridium tertium]MDB1925205.1 Na+/H+ antiporter NhaC family protein [Clostridium tertium]MDB1930291.1 Na+/H+ antiporter NhaC family protein [Clostridium tertium]MDB1943506.1 Na+/H+ antiporter NhaC family protein [Clostridium tertium]